jgi:hypothetical protein
VIAVLRAWVARHVIADDPAPELSRLDVLDGVR